MPQAYIDTPGIQTCHRETRLDQARLDQTGLNQTRLDCRVSFPSVEAWPFLVGHGLVHPVQVHLRSKRLFDLEVLWWEADCLSWTRLLYRAVFLFYC